VKSSAVPFATSYDSASCKLTLRGASVIPPELFVFAKEHTVEILEASDGTLAVLPDCFAEGLPHLKIALFSNNAFVEVPPVLGACLRLEMLGLKFCAVERCEDSALSPSLRWLIFTGNRLTSLPKSIGTLSRLRKLALAGNRLSSLPPELAECENLELIRLSANELSEVPPEWLFRLPRMAWYCDAGNPFNKGGYQGTSPVPSFSWADLSLGVVIGESPSSEVFTATISDTQIPCAVKRYRGVLTSDGHPVDDMRACLAAGQHPHLVSLEGQVVESNQAVALVLRLIPPMFRRLGLPPDFVTCTRDTFSSGTTFSHNFIESVLKGISSACAHLHGLQIQHGDLYAHNILVTTEGEAILTDYGAASFCDPRTRQLRERMEVRAFGCLMDDLLRLCAEEPSSRLKGLMDDCLGEGMAPGFDEIQEWF
jgi:hypothetical protein